jgi:putative Mg2+ transporter-C (MgtC) family protein
MQEQLQQLGTVALAGGLGAIVGFEREFADKPAGLRTHMLVCAAVAMLTLLGKNIVTSFQTIDGYQINSDPLRLVQAIVIGISFLGAGTIIHRQDRGVEGLTTAASVLLTAGIGIAVAVDQIVFAVGTSLLTVVILWSIGWIEKRCLRRSLPTKATASNLRSKPTD